MVYQVARIARDVRVALDQNMESAQLISEGDIETLSFNDLVCSKIEEAVRRVEMQAPLEVLEQGHVFCNSIFWGEHESGWLLLPDDFMRLIVFRMSDWERPVNVAISVTDPQYKKQQSRYKGIRGNVQKPVCAVVNRQEGKALEFYSCKSTNAYVAQALYRPEPKIDRQGGIDISERCYDAVVYTVGALVLTAYGDVDKASEMMNHATTLLEK